MDSNLRYHPQQQKINSGLTTYRSAPTSLLSKFVDGYGEVGDAFFRQSSSPEAEVALANFVSCDRDDSASAAGSILGSNEKELFCEGSSNARLMAAADGKTKILPRRSRVSSESPMIYQSERAGLVVDGTSGMQNSATVCSSQMNAADSSSNLVRHSSSPAGLFSNLSVENGFAVVREVDSFSVGMGSSGETTSAGSLRNQTSFISREVSFPNMLPQISDIGVETVELNFPGVGFMGNSNGGGEGHITSYPISSWNDSSLDYKGVLKRSRDDGTSTSSLKQSDMMGTGKQSCALSHQFSFPLTSAEMHSMDNFLDFQEPVPCMTRAKRGYATHPRSIAERVRRSRISERLKKLEELVPNMDKQTNKADMLDLAVQYVKELQEQVKKLMGQRATCTCSIGQKAHPSPAG